MNSISCEEGIVSENLTPYKECKTELGGWSKFFRRLRGSAFRLVFWPSKDYLWPALFFNIIAVIWLYANNIIAWFNSVFGTSIGNVPVFDGLWTGLVLSVFAFFVFGVFSLAITKFREGYGNFRRLNNSLITTMNNIGSSLDYDKIIVEDLRIISEIQHFLKGYTYSIKNSFRGELDGRKMPIPDYLQCEIITYGHPSCVKCKDGSVKKLDVNAMVDYKFPSGRKSPVTRSDVYLEGYYHHTRKRYTSLLRKGRLTSENNVILSNETGNVNTLIGAIGNAGAIPTPPGINEILFVGAYLYFGLIPPIFFQAYSVFWGFVFYNVVIYLILGTLFYVMMVANPFLDPEENLFLGADQTVGGEANATAHLIDINAEQIYKQQGYTMNFKTGQIELAACSVKSNNKDLQKFEVFDINKFN